MHQKIDPRNYYELEVGMYAGYPRRNEENFLESMYGPDGRCPTCGYLGPAIGTVILGKADTPKANVWETMDFAGFEMVSKELAAKIRDSFPEVEMRPVGKKSAMTPDSFVLIPEVLPTKIWDRAKLDRGPAGRLGFPPLHCEVCGNDRLCAPWELEYSPATQWPADPQGPLVCTYEQFGDKDAVFAFRQNLYRGDLAQLLSENSRRKLVWTLIASPEELPPAEL